MFACAPKCDQTRLETAREFQEAAELCSLQPHHMALLEKEPTYEAAQTDAALINKICYSKANRCSRKNGV